MTDLSPACWFCGESITPDEILADGFLSPRAANSGGPLRILACPGCGHVVGAERNAAGDFLLVPVEDLGLSGRIASLFDPPRTMLRAHAKAWFRANAKLRREFHASPPRPREASRPPPRERTSRPSAQRDEPPGSRDRESQSHNDSRTKKRSPAPPAIAELYGRLDLEPGADAEAVAKAFRRLSKRCHPDKVAHLDEEFQALAHRKFLALQEAYDGLMRHLARRGSAESSG